MYNSKSPTESVISNIANTSVDFAKVGYYRVVTRIPAVAGMADSWRQIASGAKDLPRNLMQVSDPTLLTGLRPCLHLDICYMNTDTFYCHGVMQPKAIGTRENLKKTHDRVSSGAVCWRRRSCRLSWIKNCTFPPLM